MSQTSVVTASEGPSFSGYKTALSATLLTAALFSPAAQANHLERLSEVRLSGVSATALAGSFQDTWITQPSVTEQLEYALQEVYKDLLASQVDLDVDDKKILYSNLWALYE